MTSLLERLSAERQRRFVGRHFELQLFQQAIASLLCSPLLKQAAESLQSSKRDEKLYRAVYRTYLNPAPTQEQAAELPFSTYHRHLKADMIRIADILWQR